jgi:hypothetical protein
MKPKSDLQVSLFQISEKMRTGLIKVSALSGIEGAKKSINDCILEALEQFIHMDEAVQPRPAVESFASRKYTIRMPASLKVGIQRTAAKWQLREGSPVPMNAVVNKAITVYLKNALKY